jgi:hypothetical protein
MAVPGLHGTGAIVQDVIAAIRGRTFSQEIFEDYVEDLRKVRRALAESPSGLPVPDDPIELAIRWINHLGQPAEDPPVRPTGPPDPLDFVGF